MIQTLKKIGFKKDFIHWVETIYNGISGCIVNNGWISKTFQICRGIRQGCPLSALIFVLAVEVLACRIRSEKNIKGFQIKLNGKDCSIKICQLADDTTLFLKSKKETSLVMNLIETFGSSLELIEQKLKEFR